MAETRSSTVPPLSMRRHDEADMSRSKQRAMQALLVCVASLTRQPSRTKESTSASSPFAMALGVAPDGHFVLQMVRCREATVVARPSTQHTSKPSLWWSMGMHNTGPGPSLTQANAEPFTKCSGEIEQSLGLVGADDLWCGKRC
eukprot:scaffold25270_cov104-Isochrysis_galbana.AAC.8